MDQSKGRETVGYYRSPLGRITLASDGQALTGLWFEGQKYYGATLPEDWEEGEAPVFAQARAWLDRYFSRERPPMVLPVRLRGTAFQKEVWGILQEIPYGKTITYKEIANRIAAHRGLSSMSAQAVGNAVGRNPVSIVVPCHRVVGKDGSLTGYAGGVEKKAWLLTLERADFCKTADRLPDF